MTTPVKIPESIITWTEQQVVAAGFSPESLKPVGRTESTQRFNVSSPTTVSLKSGWWVGYIKLATVDVRHKGNGTARNIPSGESIGMLSCNSWDELETAEWVVVTITIMALELQFVAGPEGVIVGSYTGSWTPPSPPPPPPPPPPPAPEGHSGEGDDNNDAFYGMGWFHFTD